MKIINIIGGLGNQMFQYAFALSLKNHFKTEEILIDIHHFNHYNLHNGFELSKIFKGINLAVANKKQLKKVTYYIPHYSLSRLFRKCLPKLKTEYIENIEYVYNETPFKLIGDYYFEGYWQSFKYYANIKSQIFNAFKFPEPNSYNKKLALEIASCNSIGMHIRRGDYLNHKDFKGICDLDYYKRAINCLLPTSEECCFYIFSNDIQWCEENIQPLIKDYKVTYVTENKGSNSFWDMYLMSKCKNLVIANSSFSWWGAFLNCVAQNVIVPQKWNNSASVNEIYNPEWIKI